MDREEKIRTESGTQKRPVHRRTRRPDGSPPRKPEGDAVRRRKSTAGRKKPSAAAEELRKNSAGTARRAEKPEQSEKPEESLKSGQLRKPEQTRKPEQLRKTEQPRKLEQSRKAEQPRKLEQSRKEGQPRKPEQLRKGGTPGQQRDRMSAKKRRQKRARFNVVSSVVLVAAVCVFVFSLYQLVSMLIPYYSGGKIYDEIKDIAVTADEDGSGFQVDFDALMKENSDTVAWIRFDEPAVISYPVVKSADNTEYLTKTFTANDNKLGAIFVDMRNSSDFSDRNTFIYGHHLNVGGEMFSQLLEYESESFCKEHPNFYIYTPDGKVRTYTVFSAGVVKDTADNYKIEYASDAEYEEYLKLCQDSSNYTVDVELNAQSQIVSLSTCTNVRDDERFLVQGVLTAID